MSEAVTDGAEITHRRSDAYFRTVVNGLNSVLNVHVVGEQLEEPEIITPNHIAYREVAVLGVATWLNSKNCKPPAFMAKKELLYPPVGWALRPLGAFGVDRGDAKMPQLTRYAEIARDDNRPTVIYPEGSRHKGKKEPDEIRMDAVRPGALKIANELGMNIRPAATVMRGPRQNLVYFAEAFKCEGAGTAELGERMQDVLDHAVHEADKLWGNSC